MPEPNEVSPTVDAALGDLVLRIRGTDRQGQTLRLRSAKCSVGSDPACTLRIRGRSIAPVHCVILRGPAGAVVRRWYPDTLLNGGHFLDAPLKQGDRLGIGPVEFEVLQTGAARPGPGSTRAPVAGAKGPGELAAAVEVVPAAPCESSPQTPNGSSEIQDRIASERRAVQREREELDEQRRSLEAERLALAEQRRRWEEARQAEQRALAEKAEQLARQETEWQSQQSHLKAHQAEIEKHKSELHRLQSSLEAERTRREAGERIWQQRRSELEHRAAELEARIAELDRQQRQLDALRAELDSQVARHQNLEAELRSRMAELEAREAQLAAAQQALEDQRRAFEAERAAWAQPVDTALVEKADLGIPDAPSPEVPAPPEPSRSPEGAPIQTVEVLRRLGLAIPSEDDESVSEDSVPQRLSGLTGSGELHDSAESDPLKARRPVKPTADSRSSGSREMKPRGEQATGPASEGGDLEEESIDGYMAKLLERMRAGSRGEGPRFSPTANEAARALAEPADARSEVQEPGTGGSGRTARRGPRAVPPEETSSIGAMRELANLSAHAAILRHAQGKLARARTSRLLVALFAAGASGLLYWMGVAWDAGESAFLGAGVCLVVAMVWGLQYLVLAGRLMVSRWAVQYQATASGRAKPCMRSTSQTSPACPTPGAGAGLSVAEPAGGGDGAAWGSVNTGPSE